MEGTKEIKELNLFDFAGPVDTTTEGQTFHNVRRLSVSASLLRAWLSSLRVHTACPFSQDGDCVDLNC
jgi:hypothetical protein